MDVVTQPQPHLAGDRRWVFLDAVGTLIRPEPDVATIYAEVAGRYGSSRTAIQIDEEFDAAYLALTTPERRTDEDAERAFWRAMVDRLAPDVSDADACFAEMFDRFAEPAAWTVYDDVPAGLEQLRAAGFKIAIASNFDARLRPVAAGLPELAGVDALVISTEVGWKKPAEEFWQAAVEMTDADPALSVSVGDSFNEDVKAAREVGLKGLWLKRSDPRRPASVRTFGEATHRIVAARPPG